MEIAYTSESEILKFLHAGDIARLLSILIKKLFINNMSSLAKIREQILAGGGAYHPPPPKANTVVTLEKPIAIHQKPERDSDSDSEEEIWEPSETQDETLASMDFFEEGHFTSLKKNEKKESYKNFIDWLDAETSMIIDQETAKLDLLFE